MSVINQMLKDLDQRKVEQKNTSINYNVPDAPEKSSKKFIVMSIVIIIAFNIVGAYMWQLYSENQAFKTATKNITDLNQSNQTELLAARLEASLAKNKTIAKIEKSHVNETMLNESSLTSSTKATVNLPKINGSIAVNEPITTKTQDLSHQSTNVEMPKPTNMGNEKVQQNIVKPIVVVKDPLNSEQEKTSSLTISRRQLSPQQLVKQKIGQANQALLNNDIAKAEQLFEDVLIILPSHKSARKQLAALWFGRQSYQPAHNLLSQGIALAPEDSEFRLMKARIYLSQGNTSEALQTLNVLSNITNVEYQTLLASIAQQSREFDTAANAYKILTSMQPNKGRWWLGLAVAQDSNGLFTKAKKAYQLAIAQNDLSASSATFARQRLAELGE